MRWTLSPFLLLFSIVFFFSLLKAIDEQRLGGAIAGGLLILTCVSGLLALWGVPHVGRIVTAMIAIAFGSYLIDECFLRFDGNWGWGEKRSGRTPINSIMGFFVFGLPCLYYTIFGRFFPKDKDHANDDLDDTPK